MRQTCVIVKICMYKTLRIFDINFDPEDIVDEEDQQVISVGLRMWIQYCRRILILVF